ncbi:MAG: SGNH/GDSL hydrolase family protein [Myxococcales bacterium]|nr:SGNH/GDSL hydrolase family protein [Myxococcales bacterium]
MSRRCAPLLLLLLLGCDPSLEAGEALYQGADVLHIIDASPADAAPPPDAAPAIESDAADPLDAGPPPPDMAPAPDAEVPDADRPPPPRDAEVPPPDMAPPPPAEGPARYVAGRLHSPLTPAVQASLRQIVARDAGRRGNVFAKIGDSLTVSNSFLKCFAGNGVELAGRDALAGTIRHFLGGSAAGTDPFRRDSAAATVGWSAISALRGDPSPIDQEVDALDPRLAVVMFGTNDIQRANITAYADEMFDIVDLLLSQGIIPLLSSIPPRGDSAAADDVVPSYNAIVRGIAEGRQIPFMDLEMALRPLPRYGLAGDRLHGSTYQRDGAYLPCSFTEAGLQHGYNWRNLLTIESLHRVLQSVLGDEAPPDPPAPPRAGRGTPDDPFVIDTFPFTHVADTREATSRAFDRYPGCGANQDESGPEYVYRLDLDAPTTLRAYVFDRGDVDIDIHLLGDTDPAACLDRDHTGFAASLDPGTWYFVLDSFVGNGGQSHAGEYLFVLVADP